VSVCAVTRENCVISNSSVRVESVCTLCARSATYVRTMPTMLLTMPLLLTLRHAAHRPWGQCVLAHQALGPQLVPAPARPEHHQLKLTSSCDPRALPVHALRRGAQRPCGSLKARAEILRCGAHFESVPFDEATVPRRRGSIRIARERAAP
jgi:hypothetical protein